MSVTIDLFDIEAQTRLALQHHGAGEWIAAEVAKAVRKAEATGNVICGCTIWKVTAISLEPGASKALSNRG